MAFAILKDIDFNITLTILNSFLRKRIIQYYSIQLDTSEKYEKVIIVNIENSKKEEILRAFYLIQQEFIDSDIKAQFLKNARLENTFLGVIFREIHDKLSIKKQSDSILLLDEETSILYNFYKINFKSIKTKKYFLFTFIKVINNIRTKGVLIFHFKIDNMENIKFTSYFVEKCENEEHIKDSEKKINEFFNYELVKRHTMKIKEFGNFLWRLEIANNYFAFDEFNEMFVPTIQHTSMDLLRMNSIIEQKLSNHDIKYVRLNKNLLFINQAYLFLVLERLESKAIEKLIEKFSSKYFIYILILNQVDYEKLQEIESLILIDTVKLLHEREIHQFNYQNFSKKQLA
ncbi:MAG: hypothetical protein ACFFCE_01745 [Promethearchaeota archaeon]